MRHELDDTDLKILQMLQENGSVTTREIGIKLHKSATPISERMRKMKEMGVIKKFTAVLDHKKIGRGIMAFVHISLHNHDKEILSRAEAEITGFPEVLECYHLAGEYDFLIKVAVSDMDAYHDFLMNKLFKSVPKNNILSSFVMKEAKVEGVAPFNFK